MRLLPRSSELKEFEGHILKLGKKLQSSTKKVILWSYLFGELVTDIKLVLYVSHNLITLSKKLLIINKNHKVINVRH